MKTPSYKLLYIILIPYHVIKSKISMRDIFENNTTLVCSAVSRIEVASNASAIHFLDFLIVLFFYDLHLEIMARQNVSILYARCVDFCKLIYINPTKPIVCDLN